MDWKLKYIFLCLVSSSVGLSINYITRLFTYPFHDDLKNFLMFNLKPDSHYTNFQKLFPRIPMLASINFVILSLRVFIKLQTHPIHLSHVRKTRDIIVGTKL